MRTTRVLGGLLVGVLFVLGLPAVAQDAAKSEKTRNPFGVPDIADPHGKGVLDFAAGISLAGDDNDPNAEQWAKEATSGKRGSLEGEWSERWNGNGGAWSYGTGPTKIKVVGDCVYMLVNSSNGQFLLDLKRDKNRLVGTYRGVDRPTDTGPCVLLVVNDERLDGNWRGVGRWDFRRKLP